MSKVKKVFAIILSMAMILGMSLTAFAAKTGATITVSGLSTAAEQKVDIYEIYQLDENDNNWVVSDWAKGILKDVINPSTELLNYLDKLETEAKKEATIPDDTKSSSRGTVSFPSEGKTLQAGAYLVLVTDTSNKVEYSPMIAVTYEYNTETGLIQAKQNVPVTAKAESYTTTKGQKEDGDDSFTSDDLVVEVGDLIEYEIKTTVPYNDGFLETFTVKDTLTGATYYLSGAAVKGVAAISEVTVGGVTVDGISIPSTADGQTTFTIDMSTLLKDNTYSGQEVVIRYTAKVTAVDEITNKAVSSNDTEGSTTKAKTGSVKITKYDTGTTPLSGAVFALYRMNEDEEKEYAVINNGYITGEWEEETTEDNNTRIVTGADGVVLIKGLDEGTYYFEEVIAPDGYYINEDDEDVTISATALSDETEMHDSKLSALPSTGGIGTTIFTIGGCTIMIAAAGLYFASRRKQENK